MLLKILHGHGAEVKQLVLHVDVGVLGVPGLPCGRLLYVSDNSQNLVQNLKNKMYIFFIFIKLVALYLVDRVPAFKNWEKKQIILGKTFLTKIYKTDIKFWAVLGSMD